MKLKFVSRVLTAVLFLTVSCQSASPSAGSSSESLAAAVEEPDSSGSSVSANPVLIPASLEGAPGFDQPSDKTEALRRLAQAVEGPIQFPNDWKAAESEYNTAQNRNTPEAYEAASRVYQALIDKALPPYAQSCEENILIARDNAIAAGIEEIWPECLFQADKTVLMAQESYDGGDYFPAIDYAQESIDMYLALQTACSAYRIRQEIVSHDMDRYAPEDFDDADDILLVAINTYEAGSIGEAQSLADEAHLRYSLVYNTSWQSYAIEKAAEASSSRNEALAAKANTAVKRDFDGADAMLIQGKNLLIKENYPEAGKSFIKAESGFRDAAQSAQEKRRNAEKAILKAEEKIFDSEEKVRTIENTNKGGAL